MMSMTGVADLASITSALYAGRPSCAEHAFARQWAVEKLDRRGRYVSAQSRGQMIVGRAFSARIGKRVSPGSEPGTVLAQNPKFRPIAQPCSSPNT